MPKKLRQRNFDRITKNHNVTNRRATICRVHKKRRIKMKKGRQKPAFFVCAYCDVKRSNAPHFPMSGE
jgi:hypothetical protein